MTSRMRKAPRSSGTRPWRLDPKNPAAWNNLASVYGHHGPMAKAFEYYTKAIELNPGESVYYHNLGDDRVPVPQGRDGVLQN